MHPPPHARRSVTCHSAVALLVVFLQLAALGCGGDGGGDDQGVDASQRDAGANEDAATPRDLGADLGGDASVDGGTDQGPPDAGVTCQTNGPCRIFLAGPFNGLPENTAGVADMDALCDASPNRPDTTVSYKAMISDGSARVACTTAGCGGGTSEHVDWVFKPSREYQRADGTTIGTTTANGVFAFPLDAAIETTTTSTNATLTGLLGDWTSSGQHCSGWSTTTTSAQFGLHDETSSNLLSVGTSGCGNPLRVVCVEQ